MYKVIIVDDEQNIRSGLSKILDWAAYGFEVCGEASDGEEGLVLLEKHNPDLAIVDIKMPGMSGIGMIKEMKRLGSTCKAMILSGYSDFAYAQSALEFGACGYQLKPIDRMELGEKVAAIREALDSEHRERALLDRSLRLSRDGILESLISGDGDMELISSANSRFGFDFPWSSYQVVLISPQGQETMPEALRQTVKKAIDECATANGLGLAFTAGADFALLVRNKRAVARPRYSDCIQKAVSDALGPELCFAEGSAVTDINDIYSSYLHAHKLLQNRFFIGAGKVIGAGKAGMLEASGHGDGGFDIDKLMLRLYSAVDMNEAAGIFAALDEARTALMKNGYPPVTVKAMYACLYVGVVNRMLIQNETLRGLVELRDGDLQAIFGCDDIFTLQKTVAGLLNALAAALARERPTDAVDRILDYISRNYNQDLKLETLARTFHYNSAYLGKLFRKHTGKQFNTYLDTVRMEEAKRLLEEGCKVYLVAEKTGFDNIRYFHAKFKKYAGISPLEYRKQKKQPD